MESKKEIYDLIPNTYKPLTLLFSHNTPIDLLIRSIRNQDLSYPLVIKPDTGMQGKAVLKVNNDHELTAAASRFTVDYIVQPFIPYPNEIGIFYVRFPEDKCGRITGIVEKEFLSVTGDGFSSIEELLKQTSRYFLQLEGLRKSLGEKINAVLPKNKKEILVPYGNHVRGSLFLDSSFKNSRQLEALIDNVCQSVNGFYYGRLDIRFNTYEELLENRNWCIIELNGAGSEPTHMYDPVHSLLFAWEEIIRHWKMLYKVSVQNNKRGHSYMAFKDGIKMFRANKSHVKKLAAINFSEPGKKPPVFYPSMPVKYDQVMNRATNKMRKAYESNRF